MKRSRFHQTDRLKVFIDLLQLKDISSITCLVFCEKAGVLVSKFYIDKKLSNQNISIMV